MLLHPLVRLESEHQMGISELEQLLVFAPMALSPAEGRERNYSLLELVVRASTDCLLLPCQHHTQNSPSKENPASLLLGDTGDSLAKRAAKSC